MLSIGMINSLNEALTIFVGKLMEMIVIKVKGFENCRTKIVERQMRRNRNLTPDQAEGESKKA
jgi:hypothetical protein